MSVMMIDCDGSGRSTTRMPFWSTYSDTPSTVDTLTGGRGASAAGCAGAGVAATAVAAAAAGADGGAAGAGALGARAHPSAAATRRASDVFRMGVLPFI